MNAYLFKLIFDVSGTLLDVAPVRNSVDEALGVQGAATPWFSSLPHHSVVMTITEQYAEFPRISSALLQVLGRQHGRTIGHGAGRGALAPMTQLSTHPYVAPALPRLLQAGFMLVAQANSSANDVRQQFAYAGLEPAFDRLLGVDGCRRFKPHLADHHWAAEQIGRETAECMLVATHDWDVA